MALNLQEKKIIIDEVAEIAAGSHSALAAEYRGMSANEINQLRQKARQVGVYLRVVKNTLAKRAIEHSDFACMKDYLSGPLLLAFSREDPGAAARLFGDFAKTNAKLIIKLAAIGGRVLVGDQVERLAKLPTKDQAISLLMAVMKAPVEKLARTMSETYAQAVRVVNAVADQKKSSG